MKVSVLAIMALSLFLQLLSACGNLHSNADMFSLLKSIRDSESVIQNGYYPQAGVVFFDSVIRVSDDPFKTSIASVYKADLLLKVGNEKEAVALMENVLPGIDNPTLRHMALKTAAIANLRLGERMNCIYNHGAESCVFPIRRSGVHFNQAGSSRAIELYSEMLQQDSADLESRWLLNIAYMTLGEYPFQVPSRWLLQGLDADTADQIKPFAEMAVNTGLDINNIAGGSLVEDMDNDGYLDIVTSSMSLDENMHYCRSNGNGTFTNLSAASGLSGFTGGLNIQETDYNNDGLKDIFVLRGAWKGKFGREPVSLLRNNGDGTFTDVTVKSGLLSLHPTQTATWADFNNDGWLDVFVGAESMGMDIFPCELFINNHDGTFTECAVKAGCRVTDYVKGVTSGDYNNDGRPDIFISSLTGEKRLFRNDGVRDGCVHFTDVAAEAGIKANSSPTFSTWFWDYDNDGWSDLLVCNYDMNASLAVYAAAEALHKPIGKAGRIILFHNNHDGTFTDVSDSVGLNKIVFAMGSNFGDLDNDGYPDLYFGTGNPLYQSLIPNKMFRNIDGKKFVDVTSSSRTGNLQKGHGVSFADIDNDGDLDIYIDMGGAYAGDSYQNLLFVNPGQNVNHWISVELEGVHCNRPAIGAHMKFAFRENGRERVVYKDVNSGSSFGGNPLRQHVGIGAATVIDTLQVSWPGGSHVQVFTNVRADDFIKIKEDDKAVTLLPLRPFQFDQTAAPGCGPLPVDIRVVR
jgi:hypothetical protein